MSTLVVSQPPLLQININREGEELIYDNSSDPSNPKLDITLLSSSTSTTVERQINNNNQQSDLNSTVLDSEDILSNYSTNNVGSPRNVTTVSDVVVVPDSVNEVAYTVDVLSDVTRCVMFLYIYYRDIYGTHNRK